MTPIIGIDLGTTFSAVGFVRDGVPCILANGVERIVPSVVGFTPTGQLVVGTPAVNQYVLYPENTIRSIKRLMGTGETVRLNDRDYTPTEISALILREMKRIADTLTSFDHALTDAGLEVSALDKVVFVGGSTRIPLVWTMVAEHTGLEPMSAINPDEAVALGAGVQAAIIAGEPLDAILVDVTPHSLGIAVAEVVFGEVVLDRYGVIIHRNTTLPTTRAQVYFAMHPAQKAINVKVYQGEAIIASQNTLLGEFLFEDLKPETPGEPPRITVQFDLDVSGILNVSAMDRGSAAVKQTTLQAAHTRLSPSAREASARYLADLEIAEEEDDDPLLARARKLLEHRRHDVAELAGIVTALGAAKREGRVEEAAQLNEQLIDALYELEDEDNT